MSKFQLLDKDNSALIFIDHQPQMAFGVANIDRQQLKNNVVGLAKAGKIFNVPTSFHLGRNRKLQRLYLAGTAGGTP